MFLTTLFVLLSGVSATTRRLHQNTTVISNGAELSVQITYPRNGATYEYDANQTIKIHGTASVGLGHPDVAYIYVLDVSPSTLQRDDDICGSVLECTQDFFVAFNEQAIEDGSAEIAGVITFHKIAQNASGFLPPGNQAIEDAIRSASNIGTDGTYCSEALQMAADFVEDPSNTAGTTIVVLAGDGMCIGDGGDDPIKLHEAALRLEQTGAIVHTVAVGDSVNCTESSTYGSNVANDMNFMPRNGGRCTSVKNPDELTHIIDDLLRTTIVSVQTKVDNGTYWNFPPSDLTATLPLEGAEDLNFTRNSGLLGVGTHKLCVRVVGNNTLGNMADVEDCHKITVIPQATEAPTQDIHEREKTLSSGSDESRAGMIVGIVIALIGGSVFLFYCARKALVRDIDESVVPDVDGDTKEAQGTYKPEIV